MLIFCCPLFVACVGDSKNEPSFESYPPVPDGLDAAAAALLTERLESENFVFHFRPGDSVAVERQEALHRWAVDYLDLELPKKIDYYKFEFGEMRDAVGRWASGTGFPSDYALATIHSWHPHETMHIYTYGLCQQTTIRLYDEGMAVAHEVDPLDGNLVSQSMHYYDRGDYVYAEKIQEHRRRNRLYPLEEILDSDSFDEARQGVIGTRYARVLYDQSGMFVSYIIGTFGIDKMKQAICSVSESDPPDTIKREFEEVFGISVSDAERAWLAYLDASM
jgi:hypothetical protein